MAACGKLPMHAYIVLVVCLTLLVAGEDDVDRAPEGDTGEGGPSRLREFSIHYGRMQCNISSHPRSSLCLVHHAYYWNKRFYFLTPEAASMRLYYPGLALPALYVREPGKLLLPIHPDEFKKKVHNRQRMLHVPQAIMYHRLFIGNYYHTLWETVANIHLLACKLFNKCEYDPKEQDLQEFFVDKHKADRSKPHHELHGCITTNPYIANAEKDTIPDAPVHIEQLTFGLGSEAMGQGNVISSQRHHPSIETIRGWLVRMRACMGLSVETPDVKELDEHMIMIALRARGKSGRAISNAEDVQQWMADAFPGFKVQIHRFEGVGIQKQAALWAKATIVVSTHGAQMASVFYMPNNSLLIEIDHPEMQKDQFYFRHVIRHTRPFNHIEHVRITPTEPENLNISRRRALFKDQLFRRLSKKHKQQWLDRPTCTYKWLAGPTHKACKKFWMKKCSDIIVNHTQVEESIVAAREWFKNQGFAPDLIGA